MLINWNASIRHGVILTCSHVVMLMGCRVVMLAVVMLMGCRDVMLMGCRVVMLTVVMLMGCRVVMLTCNHVVPDRPSVSVEL